MNNETNQPNDRGDMGAGSYRDYSRRHNTRSEDSTGIGDLFNSMLGFASATTVFTLNQMQNAVVAMTEPRNAMNRVRHSIDNISQAMCRPVESSSGMRRSNSDPVSASTLANEVNLEDDPALSGRKR